MHSINVVRIGPEFVVGELITDKKRDQHACGKADRQTKNINDAKQFMIINVAPGANNIIGQYHVIIPYSYLSAFTGLALATRMLLPATVPQAISNAAVPARMQKPIMKNASIR